jgi:hypothetical protein
MRVQSEILRDLVKARRQTAAHHRLLRLLDRNARLERDARRKGGQSRASDYAARAR